MSNIKINNLQTKFNFNKRVIKHQILLKIKLKKKEKKIFNLF